MRPTMTDAAKADALRAVEPFARLANEQLIKIASRTDELAVAPGAVIARESRSGHELVVIISGQASVTAGGTEVAVVGPGSVVGDLGSTSARHSPATVTAITLMHLLVVRAEAFADPPDQNERTA